MLALLDQFSIDDVNKGRERWQTGGGQVIKLSDADQAALTKELAPVGAQVTEKNAAEKAMFEILRTAAERTK